ncbi:MAG: AmmeMemoRadiSam system protein B, partial [Gammaproteobacteria bacterium]
MNNSQGTASRVVRQAAVAGFFYPQDPEELRDSIRHYMDLAPATADPVAPKAVIAPHAGYVYSGLTAAIAYASLLPRRNTISRVVLLGPAHRVYVQGLARSSATHFSTPLGLIEIDQATVAALQKLPQVILSNPAHQQEHSL